MLSDNTKDLKSERLNLSTLPSILRNLSQLGRSGIVRLSFREGFSYLELEEGEISRFLIPENLFVDYLIERLRHADLIKSNIAKLLSDSRMNLKEFSLYLVKEKISSNAQISALFMKFSRELLLSSLEQTKGSLDFNIRLDLISHIEPSAYVLNVSTTPGQLFLDYWEIREKCLALDGTGGQYFSNVTELGAIFSPLEKNIMYRAQTGAYVQALIEGIFQAKEEVIETMLRLAKSGILIAEDSSICVEEQAHTPESLGSNTQTAESAPNFVATKERSLEVFEHCLPLIVLSLIAKFVVEYQAIIYLIENAFPN